MLHFTDTQYDVNGKRWNAQAAEEEEEKKNTDEERYRRSWRQNHEPVRSC